GSCSGGKQVYQLLSWCDGEEATTAVPRLPEAEQYAIGVRAGQMLKQMQQLQTSPPSNAWAVQCEAKHARYIANYRNCGMTFDGDELLIRYVEDNQHLLQNRPLCFSHDDYHLGNLILAPDHTLRVIDFEKFRNVDPYHTMRGLIFSAKTSPHFATGQLRGYFDGNPPADFWSILALHMAAIAVNALPWSIPFGQADIDFAYRNIADVLAWYDNMQNPVPTWYACGEQSLRGNNFKP
ncbi:MAG: phosphotransferase, partial [Oscillospiraceae bacterium]|nr:phosphotransferase [Oscillospiraceae bacterium]